MSALVYEDTPKYDPWVKLLLGGIVAATFIGGVVLLPKDLEAALTMFGVTLFDALLFKVVLPRRFQIFEDKLRIVLGGPFAINIPLSDIVAARPASARKAFAYGGLRFATSTQNLVEIVRRRGLSIVISPANEDTFLEQLNQARSAES